MDTYSDKEQLRLTDKVFITKEVYKLLRQQKTKQKISMAKIVCNLLINVYGKDVKSNNKQSIQK